MHNHIPVYINHLLIFQDFIILNLRNETSGPGHAIAKEKSIIELPRMQTKTIKVNRDVDCLLYGYRANKKNSEFGKKGDNIREICRMEKISSKQLF